ncbi:MAG: alpha/beta hydrolase [Acidobacteriota bacterium]
MKPLPEPRVLQIELPGERPMTYAELEGPEERPAVLYVHGTPGAWTSFKKTMQEPQLAGQLRQISVDRPGWGGSYRRQDSRAGTEASLAAQAAALDELLDRIADDQTVVVVGHSLGAPIAARFAADYPERVTGLLLAAGSIDPELEKATWYQRLGRTRLVRWMLPRSLVAADEEIQPLRSELEELLPLWEEIEAPVFVLHGVKDSLVPVENVDFAKRVLKTRLEVELIPKRGHLLQVHETSRIAEAVLKLAEPAAP